MSIRYFFVVCAIILGFCSGVKASDRVIIHEETSMLMSPSVSTPDSFFYKQVNSLLSKVVISTHPSDHGVFWRNVKFMFLKARLVYAKLGQYLYASVLSIFNW
ncbi:hypothetical protein V3565_02470 [Bartonella sp. B10]